MCAQMMMHAVAHGGWTNTVRESALKADSGRKYSPIFIKCQSTQPTLHSPSLSLACRNTCAYACMHVHTHTCTHTRMHVRMLTHTHTQTDTHTHTHSVSLYLSRIHTRTHAHTHTHTHTHNTHTLFSLFQSLPPLTPPFPTPTNHQ